MLTYFRKGTQWLVLNRIICPAGKSDKSQSFYYRNHRTDISWRPCLSTFPLFVYFASLEWVIAIAEIFNKVLLQTETKPFVALKSFHCSFILPRWNEWITIAEIFNKVLLQTETKPFIVMKSFYCSFTLPHWNEWSQSLKYSAKSFCRQKQNLSLHWQRCVLVCG